MNNFFSNCIVQPAIAQKLQNIYLKFAFKNKQIKATKYSILLIFFFKIIKAIKMLKFALIS